MKQQKNIDPMREGLKSWSAKGKLIPESATVGNESSSKCHRRGAKVTYNSLNITLVQV